MSDAVLDEVRGRRIRSRGHWLIDFASCNYLGFDWDPEIAASIDPAYGAGARIRAGRGCWAVRACIP
ncbi:hypothetical protein [Streptomyces dysideae]|uniref:Uncharacterized protein n=1 Tax=Streptomyces dysideae TaxID=909626 RepID=A0A101URM7_9ACTN|nr:hypothetical protein [Streptomyces dysideae]KUO15608.1 hypothetical protein AQJ91_40570 [Streptomyces dysideae]